MDATAGDEYRRRIVDEELDELVPGLPAIALEGPKAVGKTATAMRRAKTIFRLDDPEHLAVVEADLNRLASGSPPILIDEWQRLPPSWDVVRRAVDAGAAPGRFLLTGSATTSAATHSGAGRIVTLRMRPLSLAERALDAPSVSLRELLEGTTPAIQGRTSVNLEAYVAEILRSGFPGIRRLSGRTLRQQLEGYCSRIVERDFPALGHTVRKPAALRRWMTAYAAAVSTTASFETIRNAATYNEGQMPAKTTVMPYHDALTRLWVVDPVPAWLPTGNRVSRLAAASKHQLADPALAAALVGVGASALLDATPVEPEIPRNGPFLGALFESLVTLSVRVYAQAAEARVNHFRTHNGDREVDLIVERADGRFVAIEVKLAQTIGDHDLRHLRWLRDRTGNQMLDAAVVTTGTHAYRSPDGIAVVPAALFGP